MKCVDEVTLHGYLDGELPLEMRNQVAAHIISCVACEKVLADFETEKTAVAKAFACDELISVPTERLRANINFAISSNSSFDRSSESFGTLRSLLALFSPKRNLWELNPKPAFASFAVAFVLLASAAVWMKWYVSPKDAADISSVPRIQVPPEANNQSEAKTIHGNRTDETQVMRMTNVKGVAGSNDIGGRARKIRRGDRTVVVRLATSKVATQIADAGNATARSRRAQSEKASLLPGEETYLDAIASLKTVVESNSRTALSPSVRDAYERNLEVIDEAIAATRHTAATDPTDIVAANFLREAYQSKLQLLGSFATQMDENRK